MSDGAANKVELTVAEAYDRWSASYDSHDNPMVFMARAALRAAMPEARGKAIVEFGCGTGANLAWLKSLGAGRLTGLDLSEGMLGRARERGVADELIHHDMSQPVPLADSVCDIALFCLSLEHAGDLATPLGEARRLLRPDGEMIIVEIHPFLSLQGAKAHFRDGGDEVHMPTFPHRFADYLSAFGELDLVLLDCQEARPRDVAGELPTKVLKRGAETPIVVTFRLALPAV